MTARRSRRRNRYFRRNSRFSAAILCLRDSFVDLGTASIQVALSMEALSGAKRPPRQILDHGGKP